MANPPLPLIHIDSLLRAQSFRDVCRVYLSGGPFECKRSRSCLCLDLLDPTDLAASETSDVRRPRPIQVRPGRPRSIWVHPDASLRLTRRRCGVRAPGFHAFHAFPAELSELKYMEIHQNISDVDDLSALLILQSRCYLPAPRVVQTVFGSLVGSLRLPALAAPWGPGCLGSGLESVGPPAMQGPTILRQPQKDR